MADTRIQDAQQEPVANLTDRIPVANGSGLPATITVQQIIEMTPTVAVGYFLLHCSISPDGLPLWDGGTWPGGGVLPTISDYIATDYVAADYVA